MVADDGIDPDCPDTEIRELDDDVDIMSDDADSDISDNMNDLATCLQLCGVDVAEASALSVKAIKASRSVAVSEMYGHGTITDAANSVHRNSNIQDWTRLI